MQAYVALLRGINVGGGNKLPMADLRRIAEGLGWQDVRSYIASGNLVFRADGAVHAEKLRNALAAETGLSIPVLILKGNAMRMALEACPFPDTQGNQLHCFFPFGEVTIDAALRDSLATKGEVLVEQEGRIWLHTPQGFGTSKLAGKLPQVLGGAAVTGRNLNTLRKLVEMLDG